MPSFSDPDFIALSPEAKVLVLKDEDPDFLSLSPEAKKLIMEEDKGFASLPLKTRATLYNEIAYPGSKAPKPLGRVIEQRKPSAYNYYGKKRTPEEIKVAAQRDKESQESRDKIVGQIADVVAPAASGIGKVLAPLMRTPDIIRPPFEAAAGLVRKYVPEPKPDEIRGNAPVGTENIGLSARTRGAVTTSKDQAATRIAKEILATNIEEAGSPLSIASLALSGGTAAPANAAVRAAMATRFAKAGKTALSAAKAAGAGKGATAGSLALRAGKEAGKEVLSNVAKAGTFAGKAVKAAASVEGAQALGRGILQNVAFVPNRLPSVGGSIIAPAVGEAFSVAGGALGRIPVAAKLPLGLGAQSIRSVTLPTGMPIPQGSSTVGQLAKEAFLSASAALPTKLQRAMHIARATEEAGGRKAVEVGQETMRLAPTAEEQYQAGRALESGIMKTGAQGKPIALGAAPFATEGAAESARLVGTETERLRKEMIAAGFDAKTFDEWQNAYVGRYYLPKELGEDEVKAIKVALGMKGDAPFRLNTPAARRLMTRQDLPEKVRQILGEVQQIGYRATKTIQQESHLVAIGKFQKAIMETPGQVFDNPGAGLVQIVKSPEVIPALAGKYVPLDTARALYEMGGAAKDMKGWLAGPMNAWKTTVTAFNPPVWTGNIINNVLIADLKKIGSPSMYLEAAKDFINQTPELAAARAAGVFSDGYEIRTTQQRMLAKMLENAAEKSASPPGMAIHLLKSAGDIKDKAVSTVDAVKKFYQSQDDFFKYMAFKDGLKRGMDPIESAMRARKMFVDFTQTPAALKRMGSSVFSPAPFVSWQHGILPTLTQGIMENPYAIAKWKFALDAWNNNAAYTIGVDPAVIDSIREARAMQQTNKVSKMLAMNTPIMLLPVPADKDGRIMIMDATRFSPLGYFMAGRFISLNPAISTVQEAMSGDVYYGTQKQGEAPKGEFLQRTAEKFGLPAPIIRNALMASLQQFAKKGVGNVPPETFEKTGEALFGSRFYGPMRGSPANADVQAFKSIIGAPQLTSPGQERGSAAMKMGLIPVTKTTGAIPEIVRNELRRIKLRAAFRAKNRPGYLKTAKELAAEAALAAEGE